MKHFAILYVAIVALVVFCYLPSGGSCIHQVWIDADPTVNMTVGERVTVRFSGYDHEIYGWCKVLLIDYYYDIMLVDVIGDCKKGYIKLALPDMEPGYAFYAYALAVLPDGSLGDECYNNTVFYQTEPIPDEPVKKRTFPKRAEINYYGDELKPEGADVWIEGDSDNSIVTLSSNVAITINFQGVEDYGDSVTIFIVADDGINNISTIGLSWGDYVRFKRFSMPASSVAYIVLCVMDEHGIPVLHFSSRNSFRMEADRTFVEQERKRNNHIKREAEAAAEKGQRLNIVHPRRFEVWERAINSHSFLKTQEYFNEEQRISRINQQYFYKLFNDY